MNKKKKNMIIFSANEIAATGKKYNVKTEKNITNIRGMYITNTTFRYLF